MLKRVLFSAAPVALPQVTGVLRVIIGIFLVYHGQEVFNPKLMAEYMKWDSFSGQPAALMVYLGKSAEFIAGILLLTGLGTRVGALITIATFLYITFFVGSGKFWYNDQHPFLFALFGLFFLFAGPGAWSVDGWLTERGSGSKA